MGWLLTLTIIVATVQDGSVLNGKLLRVWFHCNTDFTIEFSVCTPFYDEKLFSENFKIHKINNYSCKYIIPRTMFHLWYCKRVFYTKSHNQ